MNKLFILIFVLIALVFIGCGERDRKGFDCTEELNERLGVSLVNLIKDSTKVSVVILKPDFAVSIPEKISEHSLNSEEIQQLKKFLLTQEHYLLNFKKKAVFVPSIGFHFEDKEDAWVIVSFSARQINFIQGDRKKNLDYDRMAESFETFCKQLVGDHHE